MSQPYAYTCELTVARAYTFPGDFRAGAAAVGEAMTPGGCPDGVTETEQVLREYYDANKGKTTTAFPEPYDGQYLPASAGGCEEDGVVLIAAYHTTRCAWALGALRAPFTPLPAGGEGAQNFGIVVRSLCDRTTMPKKHPPLPMGEGGRGVRAQ